LPHFELRLACNLAALVRRVFFPSFSKCFPSIAIFRQATRARK